LAVLQDRNKEVRNLIESRKRTVEELKKEAKFLLERGKMLGKEAHRTVDSMSEVEAEIWAEFNNGDRTIEDLEIEITLIGQRIELVHAGNPHAIQQYEQRAKQIEDLTERIGRIESDMANLEDEITSTREKWEPELDNLVSQISEAFSHNFERIGCAGQVDIDKKADESGQDDFGQWAIRIQVKFR
jgi:structural maintenance of chromosomes protein 5